MGRLSAGLDLASSPLPTIHIPGRPYRHFGGSRGRSAEGDANCGCCLEYARYLRRQGFDGDVVGDGPRKVYGTD